MAKFLVANWKMNPGTLAEAADLFRATVAAAQEHDAAEQVVVCPPFEYLLSLTPDRGAVAIGAQDVFWENAGAYTGEVSPTMLRNAGISHVIVGHSERRRFLNETDQMINKKTQAALAAGLTVILCVGEPQEVRAQGLEEAKKSAIGQLESALASIEATMAERIIVAYEPIWAIGSGTADTPEESASMGAAIKNFFAERFGAPCRVLYGGSVNAGNVASFLSRAELDGALVGGASLKAQEFGQMIGAIKNL